MANLMRTFALMLYLARLHPSRSLRSNVGGRLAPMAVELVDRVVIFAVVRRFHGMGAVDSRSVMSVCNISSVELLMFLFGGFGGYAARVHVTSFC
jgi:hypothetical protein